MLGGGRRLGVDGGSNGVRVASQACREHFRLRSLFVPHTLSANGQVHWEFKKMRRQEEIKVIIPRQKRTAEGGNLRDRDSGS